VGRWVISSTAEVFGAPRKLPIAESARLRPLSSYGRLKAEAERLALSRAAAAGASMTILRFFNLYGPKVDGQVPDTVIRSFATRLLAGQPVVLHASRANSRDFLHVRDAVTALMASLARSARPGVYNVGSGRETTLLEVAQRIGALLGTPVDVDFRPGEGRRRRSQADRRKATRALGFRPRVGLDEGLGELLGLMKGAT
jgi:UDP-glucose 4-epimerase